MTKLTKTQIKEPNISNKGNRSMNVCILYLILNCNFLRQCTTSNIRKRILGIHQLLSTMIWHTCLKIPWYLKVIFSCLTLLPFISIPFSFHHFQVFWTRDVCIGHDFFIFLRLLIWRRKSCLKDGYLLHETKSSSYFIHRNVDIWTNKVLR